MPQIDENLNSRTAALLASGAIGTLYPSNRHARDLARQQRAGGELASARGWRAMGTAAVILGLVGNLDAGSM